jgi:nitrite reductase/ring-hydroxylating ferredoxin subunit
VVCPWHGAEFDLRSGKVLLHPLSRTWKATRWSCRTTRFPSKSSSFK